MNWSKPIVKVCCYIMILLAAGSTIVAEPIMFAFVAFDFHRELNIAATANYDDTISIWDVTSNQILRTIEVPDLTRGDFTTFFSIMAVSFSHDGEKLAVGYLGSSSAYTQVIHIFDVATGKLLKEIQTGLSFTDLEWNLSDTTILGATLSGLDEGASSDLQLWDIESATALQDMFLNGDTLFDIAWNPDNTKLAYVGYGDVSILDAVNFGTLIAISNIDEPRMYRLDWNPTGDKLAAATQDTAIYIFDHQSGKVISEVQKTDVTEWSPRIRWSPDGAYLAALSQSAIDIWDMEAQELITSLSVPAKTLDFDWLLDGNIVYAGETGVQILETSLSEQ